MNEPVIRDVGTILLKSEDDAAAKRNLLKLLESPEVQEGLVKVIEGVLRRGGLRGFRRFL